MSFDSSFPCSLLFATSLLVTVSCSPRVSNVPTCGLGESHFVKEVLYFGRNIPGGGSVQDADWQKFLAEVVTPRFPAGLTVLDARGQWQGENGKIEREQAEIVSIFHEGDEASLKAVNEIASEYKSRFKQEAVIRERIQTCAEFQ